MPKSSILSLLGKTQRTRLWVYFSSRRINSKNELHLNSQSIRLVSIAHYNLFHFRVANLHFKIVNLHSIDLLPWWFLFGNYSWMSQKFCECKKFKKIVLHKVGVLCPLLPHDIPTTEPIFRITIYYSYVLVSGCHIWYLLLNIQ